MKMQRRWVTGMAALLLTVGLMGLPREGAALPIKLLDPSGDPQLGEPDEPFGVRQVDPALNWRSMRLQFWFGSGPVPTVIVYSYKPPVSRLGSKTAKHE